MKKVMHLVQVVTVLITFSLYIIQRNMLDKATTHYIQECLLLCIVVFGIVLVCYLSIHICISISKMMYAYIYKIEILSIAIFPIVIHINPRKITCYKPLDLFLFDLTNVRYRQTGKSNELQDNLMNTEIPFNKVVQLAIFVTCTFAILLFILEIYLLAVPLFGISLTVLLLMLDDTLCLNIANVISKKSTSTNMIRVALKHAQLECFDKTQLYNAIRKIKPANSWECFCYSEIIVESIIDSILDDKEYINGEDYLLFLSSNVELIEDNKPDTMKILRYFYLYHYIKGNKNSMQIIAEDLYFQQNKAMLADELLIKMQIHIGNRWVEEMERKEFCLWKDEKHSLASHFPVFKEKRIALEKKVNNIN